MDFSESWNNNNNVHISLNEHFPNKEPSDELLQEDFEYDPPSNYAQDELMSWIFDIFDKAIQPCIQRRMFPYDLLYLPTYQNIGKWCDCFFGMDNVYFNGKPNTLLYHRATFFQV
jgi:hypothetical protein